MNTELTAPWLGSCDDSCSADNADEDLVGMESVGEGIGVIVETDSVDTNVTGVSLRDFSVIVEDVDVDGIDEDSIFKVK